MSSVVVTPVTALVEAAVVIRPGASGAVDIFGVRDVSTIAIAVRVFTAASGDGTTGNCEQTASDKRKPRKSTYFFIHSVTVVQPDQNILSETNCYSRRWAMARPRGNCTVMEMLTGAYFSPARPKRFLYRKSATQR